MQQYKIPIITSVITTLIVSAIFYSFYGQQKTSSAINSPQRLPQSQSADVGNAGSVSGSGNNSQALLPQDSVVIATVKKVNPAVVSVIVSKFAPVGRNDTVTRKVDVGGGSGFLISSEGYIITNKHVVDDPNAEYSIFTNDGKKHMAKIAALDPSIDIAVLKIDGNNYPYLTLGDSSKIEVGQSVIAIGNALGEFRNTVSIGVISGLGRSVVAGDIASGNTEFLDEVIQTDAAINPGNSGGPLLNLLGQVIGVNVAIASESQNISFALPSDSLKGIMDSIAQYGRIIRPFVGVRYVSITPEVKEAENLTVDYGILVTSGPTQVDPAVVKGSPADKAGIVENDIILEVDGIKLTPEKSFGSIVRAKKVGDTISLVVLHKGQQKTVAVKLEELK